MSVPDATDGSLIVGSLNRASTAEQSAHARMSSTRAESQSRLHPLSHIRSSSVSEYLFVGYVGKAVYLGDASERGTPELPVRGLAQLAEVGLEGG